MKKISFLVVVGAIICLLSGFAVNSIADQVGGGFSPIKPSTTADQVGGGFLVYPITTNTTSTTNG